MITEVMTNSRPVQTATVPQPIVSPLEQQKQDEVKTTQNDVAVQGHSEKDVEKAVTELTNHFQNIQRNLNFSVDEDSGVTVVKIVDMESQEVIRQIPTEDALALAQRLRESSADESGIFIHSKV